jgi:hypothetical protein
MWIDLGSFFLGNYNYYTFSGFINSAQIKLEFDETSLPAGYLNHCRDLIIIAREFSDGATEQCGIIRPQTPSIIYQLNPLPQGQTSFKLKLKKIPRYRYGLGITVMCFYWQ